MLVGSMIAGTINHPDDYRYQAELKGIIIKQSGSQCRVHVFELNGKSVDRVMFLHLSGLRIISR
jgi:hypothetical protein